MAFTNRALGRAPIVAVVLVSVVAVTIAAAPVAAQGGAALDPAQPLRESLVGIQAARKGVEIALKDGKS